MSEKPLIFTKKGLLQFQSITDWVQFKSPNTQGVYLQIFWNFFDWLRRDGVSELRELDPDELVDLQIELNRDHRSRKLIFNEILRYIQKNGENWRTRYKRKVLSTIRSFFITVLDDDSGFPKIRSGQSHSILKGKRRVEKDLNFQQLKTIIDRSNQMYRAVFSCMLVSGMGIGEVVQWSNQGIEVLMETLANPVPSKQGDLIEIRLIARKHSLDGDYHTYVGGSALAELKKWIKLRKEKSAHKQHSVSFPDAIFVNNSGFPLNSKGIQSYWMNQVKRNGIAGKGVGEGTGIRYGVNLHQIRKIFRSRWSKSDAHTDVVEYLMGHIVDALDYNRAPLERDYRIAEYSKALYYLDLTNPDYGLKDEELEQHKQELMILKKDREIQTSQMEYLTRELNEERTSADNKLADLGARIDKQNKDIEYLKKQVYSAWIGEKIGAFEMIQDKNGNYRAKDEKIRKILELLSDS